MRVSYNRGGGCIHATSVRLNTRAARHSEVVGDPQGSGPPIIYSYLGRIISDSKAAVTSLNCLKPVCNVILSVAYTVYIAPPKTGGLTYSSFRFPLHTGFISRGQDNKMGRPARLKPDVDLNPSVTNNFCPSFVLPWKTWLAAGMPRDQVACPQVF